MYWCWINYFGVVWMLCKVFKYVRERGDFGYFYGWYFGKNKWL